MTTPNTGGGAYFAGNVQAGRDVIGRDQINYGLQGEDLAKFKELFGAVYRQVDAHVARDGDADPDVLKDTAKRIEQEAAKADAADVNQVKKWLTTLARLAPDVLETAVNVLTNPGAAVGSAIKLVAHTFQPPPSAGASDQDAANTGA